jgi:hypothetical protein
MHWISVIPATGSYPAVSREYSHLSENIGRTPRLAFRAVSDFQDGSTLVFDSVALFHLATPLRLRQSIARDVRTGR